MIKPYYQDDWVIIYNCDCLEVVKGFSDNNIDLTVTSPPYDNLRDYDGFIFDFENIAKELFRITKDGGVLVWVVGDQTINDSETGTSFRQALYFKDIGFNLYDTMIYKTNKPPLNDKRYQQDFEYMFILSKNKPKTTNIIKIKTLHPGVKNTGGMRDKTGIKKKRTYNNRTKDLKNMGNIWYLPRGSHEGYIYSHKHPATFPEQLAQDHILSWSNSNDLILDPFLGSGTTARACKDLGRKCIGIEISKEYCDIAIQRLGQEVLNFND